MTNKVKLTRDVSKARVKAIPDIPSLKYAIYKVDPSGDLCDACACWAPHTHWDQDRPFLVQEKYGKDYFLRPLKNLNSSNVLAISWIITNGKLLAAEYARKDSLSQGIIDEYRYVLEKLEIVAQIVGNSNAGITLQQRYKKTFSSPHINTVENVSSDEGSIITKQISENRSSNNSLITQQVDWSPFDPYLYLKPWLHWLIPLFGSHHNKLK